VPGTISVFSVSNGSLTEVAGSPFALPNEASGSGSSAASGSAASAVALAVTPTVFPVQFAPCSGHTAPTTENLYVADSVNNVVLNYKVSSAGVLELVPFSSTAPGAATGSTPSGVAVDGCGQFVYVANATSNSVSAFTICSVITQNCPQADYSLQAVSGSPYPAGDVPGPIAVDPFAKYVYVVDTGSSQLSGFRISPSNSGGDELRSQLDCNPQRRQLDFRGQLQCRDRVAVRYHSGHWTVDPAIAIYHAELSLWSGSKVG
jgi:6-phosphogluconolactonase (cycloisomerase 2 family)